MDSRYRYSHHSPSAGEVAFEHFEDERWAVQGFCEHVAARLSERDLETWESFIVKDPQGREVIEYTYEPPR